METYRKCLALLYFKQQNKQYDLTELRAILGLQQKDCDNIILDLLSNGYLAYVDFELEITNLGEIFLISHNHINSVIKADEYSFKNIRLESQISINDIYVPTDFLQKL